MAKNEPTPVDREFVKAMADRLGLVHNDTLREWESERVGSNVMVSMTTVKFITQEEYYDLQLVAQHRAMIKEDQR